MRILHIGPLKLPNATSPQGMNGELHHGLGSDGPSRSILGLAGALAKKEVEVGVLNTLPFSIEQNESLQGIKFLTPYQGGKYNPFIPVSRWIRRIEEEFGCPDLVNFHDIYDLFSCALARGFWEKGWRYVITPRGGLSRYAQKRRSYKKIIANALFVQRHLRRATLIQALNENEERAVRLFDPKLPIVVIPNGFPREMLPQSDDLFDATRREGSDLIIGYLGLILLEIKGIDLLLKGIHEYQRLVDKDNLRFQVAGPIRFEKDRRIIEGLWRSLPRPDRVDFVGGKFGQEKRQFFRNCDIFVLPSRTEGMPIVGLEAMAHGKPCLFSEGTNMRRIIEEARGGWGYSGKGSDLAAKLLEISQISQRRLRELGMNARCYLEGHFTWDIVVKQYLDMVQTVIRKGCLA